MGNTYLVSLPECRQYNTVPELKHAILDAWSQIELSVIKQIAESMPKRLFEVLKKNRLKLNY